MEWPLLRPLQPAAREAVLQAARRRTFSRGEVVFHEGDPADALHLLVSGHLAVKVSTPQGDRATLNVLGPGGHVGELALLPDAGTNDRSATVVALDAVNFGSGWFPVLRKRPGMSGYHTVATALREHGAPTAEWLATVDTAACCALFGQREDEPAAELMARFARLFDNPRMKELVVSPKGLRIVLLAEEGDRTAYLLYRDAELGRKPLPAATLEPMMETLCELHSALDPIIKQAALA